MDIYKLQYKNEKLAIEKKDLEFQIIGLQNRAQEAEAEVVRVINEQNLKFEQKNKKIQIEKANLIGEIRFNDDRLKETVNEYEKKKQENNKYFKEIIDKYLNQVQNVQDQVKYSLYLIIF
ncbi:hypothetical protein PPERSA_01820 [Pseudocohnilembus persalinus]|uniref:Uncharacterized protein n=1 Tax=Pseudocohnilembus persalinus TaxID=266149 RepID=A0A0V0QK64_PSEPJ|nr:hypothetical protein PPERSA_01820 [Pseudocohnilembus persalinus]|eukprot:KRX02703.1 hypothetical protein PPERSA_01820 [Pseudocohnilembus persalinus]